MRAYKFEGNGVTLSPEINKASTDFYQADEGVVLLDIPDPALQGNEEKKKGKGAGKGKGKQEADLFAQLEANQQTERMHTCSEAHDRMKADLP